MIYFAKDQIPFETWINQKHEIVKMIDLTLNILSKLNVKATFFVTGYICKYNREIIQKIYNSGHEIASHGYKHETLNSMTRENFKADISDSKKILEDTIGDKIIGYRSPGFTLTNRMDLLEIVKDVGYKYDSSLLNLSQNNICRLKNGLIEFAPNSINLFNKYFPINGGFFFRAVPNLIYNLFLKTFLKKDDFLIFYIHSWEIFMPEKKINLSYIKKFIQYYNIKSSQKKFIDFIKHRKNCISIQQFLNENKI